MRIAFLSGLVIFVCALAACGDDDSMQERSDAGETAGEPHSPCDPTIPDLLIGPEDGSLAIGKHRYVKARVLDADHVPPLRYYNTWTVQLTDADGAVLDDATIDNACASMPSHPGHAGPAREVIQLDEPGTFQLSELNLWMAGTWVIQLAVSSASAAKDATTAEYTDCDSRQKAHPGKDLIRFTVCEPDE